MLQRPLLCTHEPGVGISVFDALNLRRFALLRVSFSPRRVLFHSGYRFADSTLTLDGGGGESLFVEVARVS